MKRLIILLMLVFANVYAMAQATSLVVDNQTPGWLSSKINYGDQQTVVNLKVTGFINQTDVDFINQLINVQKLHGKLDLEGVEIVDNDNHSNDNMIKGGNDKQCDIRGSLQHLILPKKLKNAYWACARAYCDTITLGGSAMHKVTFDDFFCGDNAYFTSSYTRIKNLIIREGVDTIGESSSNIFGGKKFNLPNLVSIHFPNTLKTIETYAFAKCTKLKDVNLPDSLLRIGNRSFWQVPAFKDTVVIPQKVETYYVGCFANGEIVHYINTNEWTPVVELYKDQNVFLSPNVKTVSFADINNINDTINLHLAALTPPMVESIPYYNTKKVNVYVPRSSLDLYLADDSWSKFNLFAEPNPAKEIILDKDSLRLKKGQIDKFKATIIPIDADSQAISWYSADQTIANVDANGNISAISSGSTYIYASLVDNLQLIDSCLVTVYQPVSSLQLNNSEKEIKVGDNFTLTATVSPYDADNKNIVWKSDNNSIAFVENGKVTGVKAGTAMITAISESDANISAHCSVTVLQPVTGISLDKTICQLSSIGETTQLSASVLPEDASNKTVNWRSSNENVCVVSNGQVVAVGEGEAVIIVTTADGGYMATCLVKVSPTSGIENVHTNNTGNYQIFTTEGKKLNKLGHGINIIKFKNGITKKVVVQ